jgi:hypothetical protein
MIVRARHVSMLRHIPRGGRRVRLTAVSTPMDAELRKLPASDFSAPLPHNPTLRVRDDRIWEELAFPRVSGNPEPFPVQLFLDILAGEAAPGNDATDVFDRAFARTPLVAHSWSLAHPYKIVEHLTRGDPKEPR